MGIVKSPKILWLIVIIFVSISACSKNVDSAAISENNTLLTTNNSTRSPSPTLSLTPSPTITPTSLPSPTSTPIGGSRYIIYESYNVISDGPTNGPKTFTIESNGTVIYNLLTKKKSPFLPEEFHLEGISPKGDKLLISRENNLYSVALNGDDVILLSNFFTRNILPDQYLNYYTELMKAVFWIPNEDLIVFIGTQYGEDNLYIINSKGEDLEQLTNIPNQILLINGYFDNQIFFTIDYRGGTSNERVDIYNHNHELSTGFGNYYSFSDDGQFAVSNNRSLSFEPLNLMLELRQAGTATVLEYNLSSIVLKIDYEEYWLNDIHFNSKQDKILIRLSVCEKMGACSFINPDSFLYYTININNKKTTELNILDVGTSKRSVFDRQPLPFIYDIWSPDGKNILLLDYRDNLKLYDIETHNNSYPGNLDTEGIVQDKIIWMPNDLAYPDSKAILQALQ